MGVLRGDYEHRVLIFILEKVVYLFVSIPHCQKKCKQREVTDNMTKLHTVSYKCTMHSKKVLLKQNC